MISNRRRFLLSLPGLVLGWSAMASGSGSTYRVRPGDTLSKIARDFGVSVSDLKRENRLQSDLIRINQVLKIPVAGRSPSGMAHLVRGVDVQTAKWNAIVTHHSAIKFGNAEIYDRNHRRRGMRNGLAYHFIIGNGIDSGDGEIEIGPRWKAQLDGGHVRSSHYNAHGIGICLIGNFMETRPTRRQMETFVELVDFLGNEVLGGRFEFTAHKEVDRSHTVCPGKFFPLKAMHQRFN